MKLRKITDFTPAFLFGNVVTATNPDDARANYPMAVVPNTATRVDLLFVDDLAYWDRITDGDYTRYGTFTASALLNAVAKAEGGKVGKVRNHARRNHSLEFHPKTAKTVTVHAPCGDVRDVRIASIRRVIEKLT